MNRLKSIMSYRKPAFWVIVVTIAACVVAAVYFLADPADSTLPAKTERQIKQAYLEYADIADEHTADELSLRVVWQDDDMYALYVDGVFEYTGQRREVQLCGYNEDGTSSDRYHYFTFLSDQPLYIYKAGNLYTLEEAHKAELLPDKRMLSLLEDGGYQDYELDEDLKLSKESKQPIKQAFLQYTGVGNDVPLEDVTLHIVWRSGDMYALYAHFYGCTCHHGGFSDVVMLRKYKKDGSSDGYYGFQFWDNQKLYIYKNSTLYTLKEAYDLGLLTAEHVESLLEDDRYKNSPCFAGYYYT